MTDRPDWQALDAALDAALDLDEAGREAYLDALPEAVAAAVRPLLRDALAPDPLLDRPARLRAELAADDEAADDEAADDEAAPGVGVRLGPYRLEALVGEGGMGRVYRAHRADGAFEQTVAVKVVRQSLTLAGDDVAARLRRERALLAALDHPGIARLIDGGETADGVPYLVTEFVEGAPITEHAAEAGLGVRARAALVAEVARAVDHAHRRFVVHRDLKPSNVLVRAGDDGRARPVVLDFGIAKLIDAADEAAEGSGAFPLTRTGLRLLTPAYAAPELYEPTATVTTAADVYGLGALLYELLTGRRPHEDGGAPGPARTEPTRPSQIVTAPAPEPPRLAPVGSRALRGDLDVICLRALHPDPARRYESAAAFAADLDRYLADEPIEARRDSVRYVVGRFARRNRPAVVSAAVALLALVVGLGVALSALAAERAARADAEAAAQRANVEAERATEAASLLAGLFQAADPARTGGRTISVREVLDEGLARVGALASPPVRGYLLRELARTYWVLGDERLADSLYRASVDAYEAHGDRFELARAQIALAEYRVQVGEYQAALDLYEAGWAGLRDRVRDAPLDAVLSFTGRAYALRELGRDEEALRAGHRAVAVGEGVGGAPYARAVYALGFSLHHDRDFEGALEAHRLSLELNEAVHGPEAPMTIAAVEAVGRSLQLVGRFEESEPYYLRALAYYRPALGDDHVFTAPVLRGLSEVAWSRGARDRAVALADSTLRVYRRALPGDHYKVEAAAARLAEMREAAPSAALPRSARARSSAGGETGR